MLGGVLSLPGIIVWYITTVLHLQRWLGKFMPRQAVLGTVIMVAATLQTVSTFVIVSRSREIRATQVTIEPPRPTPRALTGRREMILARSLQPGQGCEARLVFNRLPESERFARALGAAFQRSGWQPMYAPFLAWERQEAEAGMPAGGVVVVTEPADTRLREFEGTLSELGIPASHADRRSPAGCGVEILIADAAG